MRPMTKRAGCGNPSCRRTHWNVDEARACVRRLRPAPSQSEDVERLRTQLETFLKRGGLAWPPPALEPMPSGVGGTSTTFHENWLIPPKRTLLIPDVVALQKGLTLKEGQWVDHDGHSWRVTHSGWSADWHLERYV